MLPEELIHEILLRLAVRFLLQFKCVCKSWKTLISDHQFAKRHLRISSADPTLINQQLVLSVTKEPYKIIYYPLKPLFENLSVPVKPVTFSYNKKHFHRIIGSCNGLLCVIDSIPRRVRLCNPSLGLISKKSPEFVSYDCLITNYGFGYDQVNDKYKVLFVLRNKKDYGQVFTKIYTFGESDVKTIQNFPHFPRTPLGKFVSGSLNWRVDQNTVLSFDLEKETYRDVLLPQYDGENVCKCNHRMLCVLSNCLCVIDNFDFEKVHWVVWMMKEYGVFESWTKFIIIPYHKFMDSPPYFVDTLSISENSLLLMKLASSQLILYNSDSGGLDSMVTSTLGFDPHMHRESLLSPQW